MIKVAINGYGVIGRRVADIVSIQPDMQLIGIGKTRPDYKADIAVQKGYHLYIPEEYHKDFAGTKIKPQGTTYDLIKSADVIVDATPGNIGIKNKDIYKELGKPALFQGGESDEIAEMSFVAQVNYDDAKGKQVVRVVSCNTTGLCRALKSLDDAFGVGKTRAVIARRATDPDDPKKGPIDSVALDPVTIPSHHGPDVETVMPHMNVVTMAMKIPTTHMHLHSLIVSLKGTGVTPEMIANTFAETPRVTLVSSKNGIKSTAHAMDYARELGRNRSDMYENVIWEDSITVNDNEAYFFMGVHQESIVVPENIDAIRAVLGTCSRDESMKTTNKTLSISGPPN